MEKQYVEDMETEGIQKEAATEEPQPHESVKASEDQPEDAKEENVKDSSADLPPVKEPEKGMCSDPPSLPIHCPEHFSVSHHDSPSFLPSLNDGINKILDIPEGSPDIDTLSAAMPSLDLNSEEVWPPLVPPVPLTPCPYNLRSMVGKSGSSSSVGGLGIMTSQSLPKNKRGRISDLSKAKLKAKLDVANGKQHSILGVLRAVQSPLSVIK